MVEATDRRHGTTGDDDDRSHRQRPHPAGRAHLPHRNDGISGSSFDDVPLTREEAVERDSAHDDEQPAKPGSDVGLLDRADPDGSS